jgi:hypothetical protein
MNKDIDNDDSARCKSKLLRWAISWCPREFLGRGSPHCVVADLWPVLIAFCVASCRKEILCVPLQQLS